MRRLSIPTLAVPSVLGPLLRAGGGCGGVFENAADGIFILSPDERILERGLEISGYLREESDSRSSSPAGRSSSPLRA